MDLIIPNWIDDIRKANMPGSKLGTAQYIDAAARRRGAATITEGRSVGLSRQVQSAADTPGHSPSKYELKPTIRREGRLVVARDHLCVDNHGMSNTHIDGLNHFGADETWHDGSAAILNHPGPCIADWADEGLVTRGIFLDIPALRGTKWVDGDAPVGARDLDAAVAGAGVTLGRGDAILLYMGRDEYEKAHGPYGLVKNFGDIRPGIGKDGARWLAKNDVSLLLWDFMEASGPDEVHYTVHLLIWAKGLILIDNCDFAAARAAVKNRKIKAGLLTIGPLKLPNGTGCLVNPLLVL